MVDARYTTRPPKSQPPATDDGAWFAPKRFGYGAGLPLRWQGWALIGGYIALLPLVKLLDDSGDGRLRTLGFALFIVATAIVFSVSARRTRGGWKWRWGRKD
ncbi:MULTISPECIES: hypothetical protein [Novosphingobium]|jgi:hypothetical protein|uniref:Uncharacterized protein n=1 Tax=Novosphingobium subterraneum TaxID=48936 RepID=A0A0B8ZYV4_9SPHN|nr:MULTISPECIES: hypothetical protein [Novosphingobium]KHS43461.1 hypothetical protein NJ75_03770 [Novosphingobium subterraneum]QOV94065.1 hypothetical protein IM701_00740 [Novosphingobium sp. ES2-1]